MSSGDFAMNPDGSMNKTLWKDFSVRSMQQQAVKTKALATAYYGRAPRFSYCDGASQGGRQGLNLAQNSSSTLRWHHGQPLPRSTGSRFYSLVCAGVFQRDLRGVPLTEAQQDLRLNAAIHACDRRRRPASRLCPGSCGVPLRSDNRSEGALHNGRW